MEVIAKRLKFFFTFGLVVFGVTCAFGIFSIIVPKVEEMVSFGTILIIVGVIFLLIGIGDLFKRPRILILYDGSKNELWINKLGKGKFPFFTKTSEDEKYYVILISDIKEVIVDDKPEGGTKHFGIIGYVATVKSINKLRIVFTIENKEAIGYLKNINKIKVVEKQINKLINDFKNN